MDSYVVRLPNGVKLGPMSLDQLKSHIKQGKVKATTMISDDEDDHWHFAASFQEIRDLLKKYRPGDLSVINRIRVTAHEPTPRTSNQPRKQHPASKSQNRNRKEKSAEAPPGKARIDPPEEKVELYTIRSGNGVEYGPSKFEEVKELVKQGRVKATTMVFTKSTNRWHLAASVSEVRALLRRYVPSQNSILNRIRSIEGSNLRDSAHIVPDVNFSMARGKRPFWKRLFKSEG
jgi:hypothetical protein